MVFTARAQWCIRLCNSSWNLSVTSSGHQCCRMQYLKYDIASSLKGTKTIGWCNNVASDVPQNVTLFGQLCHIFGMWIWFWGLLGYKSAPIQNFERNYPNLIPNFPVVSSTENQFHVPLQIFYRFCKYQHCSTVPKDFIRELTKLENWCNIKIANIWLI